MDEKVKDQALGLVYGVAVGVVIALAQAVSADDFTAEHLFKSAFWFAAGTTALRSAGTLVLTQLGVKLPGISGG